ncbi:MAG TPA: hypothetical protein VG325_02875 [Solirubrobacteraceae bacterium]|jgi:hypothetical protein|nr:hypothetical protein [Solirubrobacteraceae bacterium]
MRHALDVRLRLHVDDEEIRPGDTVHTTAEGLLREIMTVDDEVLHIRVLGWTWRTRPISGR